MRSGQPLSAHITCYASIHSFHLRLYAVVGLGLALVLAIASLQSVCACVRVCVRKVFNHGCIIHWCAECWLYMLPQNLLYVIRMKKKARTIRNHHMSSYKRTNTPWLLDGVDDETVMGNLLLVKYTASNTNRPLSSWCIHLACIFVSMNSCCFNAERRLSKAHEIVSVR